MPNLSLSRMSYCPIGNAIVAQQGNQNITDANGNCTALYWHVKDCDACLDMSPFNASSFQEVD